MRRRDICQNMAVHYLIGHWHFFYKYIATDLCYHLQIMDNLTTQCGDHESISPRIHSYPLTTVVIPRQGICHTCLANLAAFGPHESHITFCSLCMVL
jgi:hypothetical protein